MKIFNWVQRKFRQSPCHTPKQIYVEEQAQSYAAGNFAKTKTGPEVLNSEKMEYYVHGVQLVEGLQTIAIRELVREMHHGLLAIGTFDISNIESLGISLEEPCTTKDAGSDFEVSPVEIQKLQVKLDTTFYNVHDEAYGKKAGTFGSESGEKCVEVIPNEEKAGESTRSYKINYPLRNFLQSAIEPPLVRKRRLLRSLSNLVGVKRDGMGRRNGEQQRQSKKAMKIQTSSFDLGSKTLLNTLETTRTSRIKKFLKGLAQKGSCRRDELAAGMKDNAICVHGGEAKGLVGGDEEEGVTEYFRFEEVEATAITVPKTGYWIKTDDEYVVLELLVDVPVLSQLAPQ